MFVTTTNTVPTSPSPSLLSFSFTHSGFVSSSGDRVDRRREDFRLALTHLTHAPSRLPSRWLSRTPRRVLSGRPSFTTRRWYPKNRGSLDDHDEVEGVDGADRACDGLLEGVSLDLSLVLNRCVKKSPKTIIGRPPSLSSVQRDFVDSWST